MHNRIFNTLSLILIHVWLYIHRLLPKVSKETNNNGCLQGKEFGQVWVVGCQDNKEIFYAMPHFLAFN